MDSGSTSRSAGAREPTSAARRRASSTRSRGSAASRGSLGSGVVVALDDTADRWDIVLRIAAFFRDESCGQCVPCRVGTVRQEEALRRLARGGENRGERDELALLGEIGQAMRDASICGLGQTAAGAAYSA